MITRREWCLSIATATCSLPVLGNVVAMSAQRSLRDDVEKGAQWISKALKSSGYNADFTPESIDEIERFFREQTRSGKAIATGLLANDLGNRLFGLGCYCGETLRRDLGGSWIVNETDREAEINLALKLGNGVTCWPMRRVMARYRSAEDSLTAWASSIRTR